MELYPLKVFLTVATEKSFSRAADKLLRTQPAVSLAIQKLESDLQDKLIDRSGKDLLLTDVVMPCMNGQQVYERLCAQRKNLKVLFMSGYNNDVIAHRGVLDEGTHFIQKPLLMDALALKIREALDA